MGRRCFWCLIFLFIFIFNGSVIFWAQAGGTEKKEAYLLPGDFKEGWKVFNQKKCSQCHAIWGEGGKGGPDLGTLPETYVNQSHLAALMWNHWPEMWGKMSAQKIPIQKMEKNEMADLFAFLYFIRYMDEPGDAEKGKRLLGTKGCTQCHTVKEGTRGDLSYWGIYANSILWAQMMWNHILQMNQEMKTKDLSQVEFRGNEMADLIAYIRTQGSRAEKVYLSPGDPRSGEKLFVIKGCNQCHSSGGESDLSKRQDFPRTMGQFAGKMWNHSGQMREGMERRGIRFPTLSSQEMSDLVAYLFFTRYFDEPGNPERGSSLFVNKQCNLCHAKKTRALDLSHLKGRMSPIRMAQTMWNHGAKMLEGMRKLKTPWQTIDGREMVDLIEYLNRGMQ